MISSKNRSKKSAINRFILIIAMVLALPGQASAQDPAIKQFQRQFTIGGKLPSVILLNGYTKDAAQVEKLIDLVISKANEIYSKLDAADPSSEVAKVNLKAGKGAEKVSDDVLAAFETAEKVSEWTRGAFDIAFAGEGSWRDVNVNKSAQTVEIKKAGAAVRFDPMINGFMSELVARYIYAAGMQNVMVKVGNVFRAIGQNLNGPWKIEVADDAGTFALRALNLPVINSGVATVSASQFRASPPIDPRSKKQVGATCKGVVVMMNDAAMADALANGIFILGPEEGMKVLSKTARGLIVDNSGKFLRSPGF